MVLADNRVGNPAVSRSDRRRGQADISLWKHLVDGLAEVERDSGCLSDGGDRIAADIKRLRLGRLWAETLEARRQRLRGNRLSLEAVTEAELAIAIVRFNEAATSCKKIQRYARIGSSHDERKAELVTSIDRAAGYLTTAIALCHAARGTAIDNRAEATHNKAIEMAEDQPIPSGEPLVVMRTMNWAETVEHLRELVAREALDQTVLEDASKVTSQEEFNQLESLAAVVTRSSELETARLNLDSAVERARSVGLSWSAIGRAVGISPQAAHRRWDPEARKKHSDYRRSNSEGGEAVTPKP